MRAAGSNRNRIDQLVAELVVVVNELLGGEFAAEVPSFPHKETGDPEADTIRFVSWLHAFYRESARTALEFIGSRSDQDSTEPHRRDVVVLRTYFQHHLSGSVEDAAKRGEAEEWLACASGPEGVSADWHAAYQALQAAAHDAVKWHLDAIDMRDLDLDEVMRETWNSLRSREVNASRADPIIRRIADEIGLDSLDVATFRNRNVSGWQGEMRSLVFRTDPERYLEGLIQRDLVRTIGHLPMPITGVDVMDAFGIPPGPEVGRVLVEAQRIWEGYEAKPKPDALLRDVATAIEMPLVTVHSSSSSSGDGN